MNDWTFKIDTTDGQDPTVEMELYVDRHNVVVLTLSASGLTWAAIANGKTVSGKLTGVKCTTTLTSQDDKLQGTK